jgi:predicted dehydrogenase
MIRVGIIGYGYWGKNIVRNFSSTDGIEVVSICDIREEARLRAQKEYPRIARTSDINDIISLREIDAVAVITPLSSHFELAKQALKNGKHVFVEKPFTSTSDEAEELIELAEKNKLIIMVDHTFLFTGAVRKIKELVQEKSLGDLYYYDSVRVNLGLFQRDVNVIWDLAPHDLAVMDYLFDENPLAVSACGKAHINHQEDTAYVTVTFRNNFIAHFNVNWLSPVKVRTTLISGSKKMLIWNDLEADEKIKIYDRGVEKSDYSLLVNYRAGDMYSPRIEQGEALKREIEYFLKCINENTAPINDGNSGLRIVKMLEASSESLRQKGKEILL